MIIRQIKKFLAFIVLMFAVGAAATAAGQAFPTGPVSPQNLKPLIAKYGKRLTVIDVRTPSEFMQGHLAKARNIPVTEVGERINEIPAGPVLVVCRSGNRARIAYNTIRETRPGLSTLWYLDGRVTYHTDGTFSLN